MYIILMPLSKLKFLGESIQPPLTLPNKQTYIDDSDGYHCTTEILCFGMLIFPHCQNVPYDQNVPCHLNRNLSHLLHIVSAFTNVLNVPVYTSRPMTKIASDVIRLSTQSNIGSATWHICDRFMDRMACFR